MSQGLMCLTCRKYIHSPPVQTVNEEWRCTCETPRPSWDGKTETR